MYFFKLSIVAVTFKVIYNQYILQLTKYKYFDNYYNTNEVKVATQSIITFKLVCTNYN